MKKYFLFLTITILCVNFAYGQWTEQTSGVSTSLASLSAVTDNIAWACGASGRVVRTTDGGTTWAPVTNPSALLLNNIFGISATTALTTDYAATGTKVFRTTDGGTTWTQVFSQATAVAFIDAIWMTSATNGFMMGDPVGGRWSLWKTTNGGANWDSTGLYLAQVTTEAGWNNGMFIRGSSIWFNTNAARVYYSSNNGTNWNQQTIVGGATFGGIWFNDALNGLLFYNAAYNRTRNSGTAWLPSTVPGTTTGKGITGKGSTWFTVRDGLIIYKSIDNGVNWTTDYTAPAGNYTHIQKAITGDRMWAIRAGGQISKSDQLMGITPISGEVPNSYSLSQNYPNPFNPATNIEFAIPKSSNVVLKVYNILGKEAATIYSGFLSAGKYVTNFNASELSTGIYFYTINAGNFTETKKMILVK